MRPSYNLLIFFAFFLTFHLSHAGQCGEYTTKKKCPIVHDKCCGTMGGVQYCDSSAGRLVCKNGFYSSCYCTRHAVMDFEHLQGCCLWQGGVMKVDEETGVVICFNGSVSAVCSLEGPPQSIATW